MSEQLTDQVLVERVQKGDQKAFNLLVVRYQHKVASLVSRYVPPGDIADVVQESFVKAWRELRQIVFRTIESLPEDLRMAITLRELDGLSYEEIAAIMDCPVGTVRSRIFRAREAIDNKVQPLIRR